MLVELENKIGEIERISVRLVATALLLLALLALLVFSAFHFAKFISYLWLSW
jgi:hypothetical protein